MNTPLCSGALPALGLSRRQFLNRFGLGMGGLALADLIHPDLARAADSADLGVLGAPHRTPKAKRVIYLFMSGGPSQLETWDYKPLLNERHGQELPDSVRMGQRLTGMSGNQASLPLAGSAFRFSRHGKSGTWVSEILPHTARVVDDLCVVRSYFTEAINHDPAITFLQTGSQVSGRPSVGSWVHYGLGTANQNLPSFVVLITRGKVDQPLYSRLWGNGFLPARHQGVQFRSGREPVLYLNNPEGIDDAGRRRMLDRLRDLHDLQREQTGVAVSLPPRHAAEAPRAPAGLAHQAGLHRAQPAHQQRALGLQGRGDPGTGFAIIEQPLEHPGMAPAIPAGAEAPSPFLHGVLERPEAITHGSSTLR